MPGVRSGRRADNVELQRLYLPGRLPAPDSGQGDILAHGAGGEEAGDPDEGLGAPRAGEAEAEGTAHEGRDARAAGETARRFARCPLPRPLGYRQGRLPYGQTQGAREKKKEYLRK